MLATPLLNTYVHKKLFNLQTACIHAVVVVDGVAYVLVLINELLTVPV